MATATFSDLDEYILLIVLHNLNVYDVLIARKVRFQDSSSASRQATHSFRTARVLIL